MNTINTINIDPVARTVEYRNIHTSNIAAIIGCRVFSMINIRDGHAMFIDDEGRITADKDTGYFKLDYPAPIAGVGVIVGPVDEDCDSTSATLSLADIERDIIWINNADVGPVPPPVVIGFDSSIEMIDYLEVMERGDL